MFSPEQNLEFKKDSLELLSSQLENRPYPGYPAERYVGKMPEDLTIPDGPWEVNKDETPTPQETESLKAGGLSVDSLGRPLHPWLPEMVADPDIGAVTSKGFYWNWGDNQAGDPIAVRLDLKEPHILLIERKDTGQMALPGGFVDSERDNNAVDTAIREAGEEALINLKTMYPLITTVYSGPVADVRSTAHAWPETTAVCFQIPDYFAKTLPTGPYKGASDARTAVWTPESELGEALFGSHLLLAKLALEKCQY